MSSAAIFKHKLDTHDVIFYDDIHAVIYLYEYDAASTVPPAIAAIGELYKRLKSGEIYEYCDKYGVTKALTFNGFKNFVIEYFDERMYHYAVSYYNEHINDKKDFNKESASEAAEFLDKLRSGRILRESELASLLYLYTSGDASSVSTALKAILKLFSRLRKGNKYEYCGKDGSVRPLTLDSFREFMVLYFNEDIYCDVVSNELISCVRDHRPIFYEDLESLIFLSETDRHFAVSVLCALMNRIYKNESGSYYDKSGKHCSLTKYNFKIFVTDYFGEEIYLEVCDSFNLKNQN